MCNSEFKGFKDLEDWDNVEVRESKTVNPHVEEIGGLEVPGFEEKCPKCHGRGKFIGYTGRVVGDCFKCKGKGKLYFKTAPEARAKARKSAQKRKVKNEEANIARFEKWLENDCNPAIKDWLKANRETNGFARSLIEGGIKYGSLSEKQQAAVLNNVAKAEDAESGEWAKHHEAEWNWIKTEAENGNEFAASLQGSIARFGKLTENQLNAVRRNLNKAKTQKPSDLDISSLKGFYAVPGSEGRLKLCVRKPGKQSRYHGWTFVDDGAAYGSRKTYGKQAPEGTYVGDVQDALSAILKDPLAAQKAYGHLTGTCGRCGRILEDEQSVAAGIGPICAEKALGG